MCILKGFPTALQDAQTVVPVRHLVRQRRPRSTSPTRATATTPSRPRPAPTPTPAAQTDRRPAEVGVQRRDGSWTLAYTLADGPGPRRAVHRPRLPDRQQRRHRPAVVARHRRPAQHHRPRQRRRHASPSGPITSTVSGNGDQGADPNKLVAITDDPPAAAPAAGESFTTTDSAASGEVLRGVSLTPGSTP